MLAKVAIVGRPNVGKSTLFNRIIGQRLSITDDQPGVTRDRIYKKASWLGREFNLIDTGGIQLSDAPFLTEIKAQVEIALDEAKVIIFVCDCRNGLTDDDIYISRLLYKTKKPVVVAVNKVDDNKFKDLVYDFYSLGFSDVIPISSNHGIGIGDMLDKVNELLPDNQIDNQYENRIKFSLIGRPNVGKSSLNNALLNDDRVIVSSTPGTTTDAIDTMFTAYGKDYVVIDTAGIRKKGKIYENCEKYSIIRTVDAIERSDIVLLVFDASTGFIEQDKHIYSYVSEYNKPVIIVINKWDTIEKDSNTMKEWEEKIRNTFKYLYFAPIVFLSALEKKRVHTIFEVIDKCHTAYNLRVQTSVLNDVFTDSIMMFPPSEFNHGKPKFYYITQVGVMPPTFLIFMNNPDYVHFSYLRYLENQLRKNFDLEGTPIRLVTKKRD